MPAVPRNVCAASLPGTGAVTKEGNFLQQFFEKLVDVALSSFQDFPRHFLATRCTLLGASQCNLLGGSPVPIFNILIIVYFQDILI